MIKAVIGKNFGDEGKGLAVDHFCSLFPESLVIKHNGGAQAGHTVVSEGRRFVFHQLSSGSFQGAATYFASTYYPDLYKLREETEDFGNTPLIYCYKNTPLICIDDVLINMALEDSRGDKRHGSCGMGINEGFTRSQKMPLYAGDVFGKSSDKLVSKLKEIRECYTVQRLKELELLNCKSEYMELLFSDNVLCNAAEEMLRGAELIRPVDNESEFIRAQENMIFESGQGLLLDSENETYAPHVTASRTGLHNIIHILSEAGLRLNEACYVTRTYVTRHGAGYLPCECSKEEIGSIGTDKTNMPNHWQGSLRYAVHESTDSFVEAVKKDLRSAGYDNDTIPFDISLFVTHLNETDSSVVFCDRSINIDEFFAIPEIASLFVKKYLSYEG